MKTKTKMCALVLALTGVVSVPITSKAQEKDIYDLSIEELMQIPIKSASKKEETLFKAPLASFTITAKEIAQAGVNNIPEALRLAPGMIVRQQTNGVYDVQIRGLDNLIRGNSVAHTNRTTLVMINNRPVFNHNLGGTFWESLPIGLADIKRIEIVRGPAASLFGPNAVTGVINLITRQADSEELQTNLHAEMGSQNSSIISTHLSKSLGDKWGVFVSGNYQSADRFTDEYLTSEGGAPGNLDELPEEVKATLNGDRSLERKSINAGVVFNPNDDVRLDLSFGHQNNDVLKNFLQSNGLSMGWASANSNYVNLDSKYKGLKIRSSYWSGKENVSVNAAPGKYDYEIFETTAEYEIKVGEIGTVIPGLSYTRAHYSDEDYMAAEPTLLQGAPSIDTRSASVRTDWNLSSNWRLIAALRFDSFTTHDDPYLAYQLASTYSIGNNNLIRASISRSNNGSFIGNNFVNSNGSSLLIGQENIDLLSVTSIEVGYRSQLSAKFQLDLDLFRQQAQNPNSFGISGFSQLGQPLIQVVPTDIEAIQTGVTLSLNIVPSEKIQIKPFITYQKTEAENVPSSTLGQFDPTFRLIDSEHKQTPNIVGGWYVNYHPLPKFNVNISGYFHSEQTIYSYSRLTNTDLIYDGKFLMNANVSYTIRPWATIFLNVDNIFEDDSREYLDTERIGRYIGTGIKVNFNK